MRKIAVISAVAGVAFGFQSATAADLSGDASYKDTPYVAPLAPIWGGFYVGGHAGGLWNDDGDSSAYKRCREYNDNILKEVAQTETAILAVQEPVKKKNECVDGWRKIENVEFKDDDDDVSFIGGVHVGYNWQTGAKVFGVEGDVSFADNIDYLASLRARLGHAMDNWLIYATAGVAFVGFDDKTVNATFYSRRGNEYEHSFDFSGDNEVGAVVGGGIETKLASNLSLGVEGLYYFFGDNDNVYEGEIGERRKKEIKIKHEDDNDMFVIRGRLTYHLQDTYEAPLK